MTLRDFLHTYSQLLSQASHARLTSAHLDCVVNGAPGDCAAVVPRTADVVEVRAYHGSRPMRVVRPVSPPVPDVPSSATHGSQAEVTSHSTGTMPHHDDDSLVIFDVYNHARVVPCRPNMAPDTLVQLARQHTPQIGAVFGFRWALACRLCQLPDFLVDAIAELESTLWINEARHFPLDPDAARRADTARLVGHGLTQFLLGQHDTAMLPSPSAVSASSSQAVQQFLADLPSGEDAHGSHFVVFAEPHLVFVLPIPSGASLADLVYSAFQQCPNLGPRCGHRILTRPVPGLPPIQVCIWDNLAVDQRVLQFVVGEGRGEIHTIRCQAVANPVHVAATSPCRLLNQAAQSIADRTRHVWADGIPLQPASVYLFRHFEVLRLRPGPAPTRLPGVSRFLRNPLPANLDTVPPRVHL